MQARYSMRKNRQTWFSRDMTTLHPRRLHAEAKCEASDPRTITRKTYEFVADGGCKVSPNKTLHAFLSQRAFERQISKGPCASQVHKSEDIEKSMGRIKKT